MPRSLRSLLLAALASLVFAALPSSAAAAPAMGSQFHCNWSNYTDAQRGAVLDRLAGAGVTWTRIDIGWDAIQPQRGARLSSWHIDLADRCVDMARARGLRVLGMLHMTPGWANGEQGTNVPPTDVGDYAWIAGWAARHFRGRIAAWEVWNEPNLADFWAGDVVDYVALLRAAYPAFKQGDPQARVVFGGVAYNDDAYIRKAYAAGAKGSFDVLATHPYQGRGDLRPEAPDDGTIWRLSHLPAVRKVMVANGDGGKPIWFSEFGWSAHGNWSGIPSWQRGVSLQLQARYLVRALEYIKRYPYVTQTFWYAERNRTDSNVQANNYGLLYRDLTPKPAYHALQDYLTGEGSGEEATPPVVRPVVRPTGLVWYGRVWRRGQLAAFRAERQRRGVSLPWRAFVGRHPKVRAVFGLSATGAGSRGTASVRR